MSGFYLGFNFLLGGGRLSITVNDYIMEDMHIDLMQVLYSRVSFEIMMVGWGWGLDACMHM